MSAEPPKAFVLGLLSERYDVNLGALDRRIHAELKGEREYLVCGLLDLCGVLLESNDPDIEQWRRKRRGETKWPIEQAWLAASLVADVRAMGYGRKQACRIVQAKLYPELSSTDGLYRTLSRFSQASAFDHLSKLRVRSPEEARASLAKHGIYMERGKLPERTGQWVPWWGRWDGTNLD